MLNKLYEDSWTALLIEFLLFITIASVSATVLPVWIFCSVCFFLGIVVAEIQIKRRELSKEV